MQAVNDWEMTESEIQLCKRGRESERPIQCGEKLDVDTKRMNRRTFGEWAKAR